MDRNNYTLVDRIDGVRAACSELSRSSLIGLDTETTSLDPYRGRVRLLQLSSSERNYVFDLFKFPALYEPALRDLLQSSGHLKIAHNAKFDLKMLLHHHHLEVHPIFDTLLASKLIAAGQGTVSHGLAAVSDEHLGEIVDKTLQNSSWSGPLTEEQFEYAARDSALMPPLYEKLSAKLEEMKMADVGRLEFECVLPLASMELAGMYVDQDCWRHLARDVEHAHEKLSDELRHELAAGVEQLSLFGDPEINLDSPTQITDALSRMGIKVDGTRNWQLQPLAKMHPVIQKLLEYRTVQKSLSSYGSTLLEHINPITGRLHPHFHQIGATGGRMACSDPNLQQVPNSPEYRACFSVPSGRKLVIADYSQIELRILADWSQDTALVKALESGEDLHAVTASQMLGVKLENVSKDQRAAAKQLNYGLIYGLGPHGLANRLECSLDEAESLIRKYFHTYSGVADWLAEAAKRAVREREARTRSGRLIRFTFDPTDRAQVSGIERLGKNSPIQGSCADILKRALARLYGALKPFDAKLVNCVHDEVVVEAAESQAEECCHVVEKEMVAAAHEFIRSVPVTTDAIVSDAWLK
ncbi:MAG TPA: DNA polymerase [Blastocatellia bacterium]|nr:DNA polymerase [Blastocatellia bacterium]